MQPGPIVRIACLLAAATCAGAGGVRAADEVPVPGGLAALSEAIGANGAIEPVRFASEFPRIMYEAVEGNPRIARRIAAAAAALHAPNPAGTRDLVPIPLTAGFWSTVVFRRTVAAEDLVAAIVTDRSAALLCRGLAGMDDETIAFLAEHPPLVRYLYENATAIFSAFADSIRIAAGRVVVPGGDLGAAAWKAWLAVDPADPDEFLRRLLTRDGGRTAYLYDTLAHLDPARRLFALGASLPDARRRQRFEKLAEIAATSCPEWIAAERPFGRAGNDLAVMLRELAVDEGGRFAPPAGLRFWSRVFGGGGSAKASGERDEVDAAWLADAVVTGPVFRRGQRIEQVAFAQRVFGSVSADADRVPDVVAAYVRYPMLLLALERAGLRSVATYAAAVRAADELARAAPARAATSLAEFQGALALVVRMTEVGTLDRDRADTLVRQLASVPLADGEYRGGVARWIADALLPALGSSPAADPDEAIETALSGPRPAKRRMISWEGQTYLVDLSGPEHRRLTRARDRLAAPALRDVVGEAVPARGGRSNSDVRRVDAATAAALRGLVYALYVGDPDGPALIAGDPSARHDFGISDPDLPGLRPWLDPREIVMPRVPRFVSGSLLNLDLALAPLALLRMDPGRIARPSLGPNDRDALAQSVALMNPFSLRDEDLETIAGAIGAGRAAVTGADDRVRDVLAERVRMDGWTRRSMTWAVARGDDPLAYFSLADLMVLGDATAPSRLGAWGPSVRALGRCVCTAIVAPAAWPLVVARLQQGVLAAQMSDLALAVALRLHERGLPAALARGILAAATPDLIDEAQPTDSDDWFTALRAARAIDADRFDDYVAALTAVGPLVPAGPTGGDH